MNSTGETDKKADIHNKKWITQGGIKPRNITQIDTKQSDVKQIDIKQADRTEQNRTHTHLFIHQ